MEISLKQLLEKTLKDEVIVFQTDTVYGIGCLLHSEQGVHKIYDIKKRDKDKPMAVLCSNLKQVQELVNTYDEADDLIAKHWPGALTIVFPKTSKVPDYVTSGFSTVGVRIPFDEIALQILEHFGPMAVTSLNESNEDPVLKYEDALLYANKVDYIVKGTDLDSISSTVYDISNKKILRQGDIKI